MVDAIILCGGLGTRFHSVSPDIPKVLSPVGEETFLDILLALLYEAGIRRVVLCIGYLADQVRKHCGGRQYGLEVVFSSEVTPLGTGGAIRNALPLMHSEPFLVFNGDSLCGVSLTDLLHFHTSKQALVTLTLVEVSDTSQGGRAQIDYSGRLEGFKEKQEGCGFINAGIYVMSQDIVEHIPVGRSSLEREVLPSICFRCFGFVTEGTMLDIGTAERFKHIRDMYSYSLR